MTEKNDHLIFKNFGGLYQLKIETWEDLAQIQVLDTARWAATSAPVREFQCDVGFLNYMDPAKTGRIRVSQVLAARDWTFNFLAKRTGLDKKTESLVLDDINTSHDEGKSLRHSAEHILAQLNADQRDAISLAQVRTFRASYDRTLANGDGIVCAEVVPEDPVAAYVKDIIATGFLAPDKSSRPGVGAEQLDKFLASARNFLAWRARGLDPSIAVWDASTASAADAIRAIDQKIEQFFWQCDLLRQDPVAATRLKWDPDELKKFSPTDNAAIEKFLNDAPLATPNAAGKLDLSGPINPYFQARLDLLRGSVLFRALGPDVVELDRKTWRGVKAIFQPYETWVAGKPPEPFDKLGDDRIKACLAPELESRLRYFIGVDNAAAGELKHLENLEKLILYQRWLIEFVNNFVNFSHVYDPRHDALFEMGTIVIDGRRLEFSVRVIDRPAHKKIASESKMFLVYASISDGEGKTPAFEVAAPVTTGERGRLVVGKRGIFIGIDGKEYDSQIVEIVENPISIYEATKAPFRRAWELIGKKIEDFATSRLQSAETATTQTLAKIDPATGLAAVVPPAAPATAPAANNGNSMVRDMLIGGGLAVAALGSALAYVVSAMSTINPIKAVYAVITVVGLIVFFSGFLGWLKLRLRDMGPLLEANGWAINLEMKLTYRLGRLFTRRPGLPPGAHRDHRDILAPIGSEEYDRDIRWRNITIGTSIGVAIILGAVIWFYGHDLGVAAGFIKDTSINEGEVETAPRTRHTPTTHPDVPATQK